MKVSRPGAIAALVVLIGSLMFVLPASAEDPWAENENLGGSDTVVGSDSHATTPGDTGDEPTDPSDVVDADEIMPTYGFGFPSPSWLWIVEGVFGFYYQPITYSKDLNSEVVSPAGDDQVGSVQR